MISITAKGAQLIKDIPEPLHEQLSDKLKKLSPEQLKKLVDSFDVIINFLDIENIDAAPIITAAVEISKQE